MFVEGGGGCCHALYVRRHLHYLSRHVLAAFCILVSCIVCEKLTLLLPVAGWVGDSTDLYLNCNISKTVKVNATFTSKVF